MDAVSLAKAKASLSALIERARGGETISITRRGRPVANLIGAERVREKIDIDRLRALTAGMKHSESLDDSFIRGLRDDVRY